MISSPRERELSFIHSANYSDGLGLESQRLGGGLHALHAS